MGYSISRVYKAVLTEVSDDYIDYKKDIHDKRFYFARIDKVDHSKENYKRLMEKLRRAIKNDSQVNLVLERRPGTANKNQMIDYLIKAEFW